MILPRQSLLMVTLFWFLSWAFTGSMAIHICAGCHPLSLLPSLEAKLRGDPIQGHLHPLASCWAHQGGVLAGDEQEERAKVFIPLSSFLRRCLQLG